MADLDKEFVEYVVKALVSNPDAVEVKRSVDDLGILLELTVDPADMGKVIGKAGATAKSIRTLLRVLGSKGDERVNLKIVEPEGSEREVRESVEAELAAPPAESEAAVGTEAGTEAEAAAEAPSDLRAQTEAEMRELADLEL